MIGWGRARLPIPLGADIDTLRIDLRPVVDAASLLRDVPVEIDLASDAGASIAIVGDDAPAVARSLLVQLAVQTVPPTGGWSWSPTTWRATRGPSGSRMRRPVPTRPRCSPTTMDER